jgi:glucokinase
VAQVCINLPGWEHVPLAEWLEARLQRPVTLANDGNCAVLGEQWLGAAKGIDDVVLLTLGTGVGGGVILGGQLFLGRRGAAAEPGLIGLDPAGPPCNSGNNGSIETFCSIGALARWAGCPPDELSRRATNGDAEALEAWQRYGQLLGCGISSLVYAFTPERVLLGGGLSAAFPFFAGSLQQEVERRVLAPSRQDLVIAPASLGNGAGRLGAARLALERLPGRQG